MQGSVSSLLLCVTPWPVAFRTQEVSQWLISSAIRGWYLLNRLTMPKNLLRPDSSLGISISSVASTFLQSTRTPSELMMLPRRSTEGLENSHFSSLRVRLASCSLWRVASRCSSYSSVVLPKTRISSTWQRAPSVPFRTCEIRLWKCLGVELMPKGRRLKQNLPNGSKFCWLGWQTILPECWVCIELAKHGRFS